MTHDTEITIHRKTKEKGYVQEVIINIDNSFISDTILNMITNTTGVLVTTNRVITERCHDDR